MKFDFLGILTNLDKSNFVYRFIFYKLHIPMDFDTEEQAGKQHVDDHAEKQVWTRI